MNAETTTTAETAPQTAATLTARVSRRPTWHGARGYAFHLVIVVALIAGWQIAIDISGMAPLVLPGPARIVSELIKAASMPMIWINAGITLIEIMGGFVCGSALGLGLGAAAALSPGQG